MKIIKLEASNIKRLRAISITPGGDVVEVAGRNGQGKTSTLDSVALALEGAAVGVAQPLRKGADKGVVRLDLGDLIVTRRYSRKEDGETTSSLKVEARSEHGVSDLKTPQAVLDRLVGPVAFDPHRLARMKPKERRAELLRLVKVEMDLDAAEKERAETYQERTLANRRLKDLDGALALMPPDPGGDLPAEASIAALAQEAEEIRRKNRAVREARTQAKAAAQSVESAAADVAEAKAALEEAAAALEDAVAYHLETQGRAEALAKAAEGLVEADEKDLIERIARVEAQNIEIRKLAETISNRRRVAAERAAVADKAQALTDQLDRIEAAKTVALAAAEMPLPGLSVTGDDVALNGIPFADLSASEQIRLGLTLGLKANPKLRVALIRDGSLLDEQAHAVIREWATKEDAQVWIETVGGGGEGAIVIEDGAIVGAEEEVDS